MSTETEALHHYTLCKSIALQKAQAKLNAQERSSHVQA